MEEPRMNVERSATSRDRSASILLHGDLTRRIVGAFYAVYFELGYGFLESVYRNALSVELRDRGLTVEVEAPIAITYRGHHVGHFRADILVERQVVVELKASASVGTADRQQLLNYLRGTGLEVACCCTSARVHVSRGS